MTHVARWGVFCLISFSSTFLSQHSLHNVLCNSYNSDQSRVNVIQSLSSRIKNRNNRIFKMQHFGLDAKQLPQSEILKFFITVNGPGFWYLGSRGHIFRPHHCFCSLGDFALPACSVSRRLFCGSVLMPRSSTRNMLHSIQPQLWLIRGVLATALTETLESWVKMEGAVVNRDLHHPPNMVVRAIAAVMECIPKESVDNHDTKTQEEKRRVQQKLIYSRQWMCFSSIDHEVC